MKYSAFVIRPKTLKGGWKESVGKLFFTREEAIEFARNNFEDKFFILTELPYRMDPLGRQWIGLDILAKEEVS